MKPYPLLLPLLVLVACAKATSAPAPAAPLPEMTSASALFDHGMALAHRGDTLRAEQYITLAVAAGFPRERAILPLVQVCIASSRLRAALNHAQPFLRSHPSAWSLRYLVAAIEHALGHEPAALAELGRVIAGRPQMAQAHYLSAVIERDAYRNEAAARAGFLAYVGLEPRGTYAPEALAWLAEHPIKGAETSAPEASP